MKMATAAGKALAAVAILSVGAGILAFGARRNAGETDFITYWAAGQQLAHRLNAYDGPAILRIQQSVGFAYKNPFFMRNPPWAFFLALPLGFLSAVVAVFVWSAAIVAALMTSVHLLWVANGRGDQNIRLAGYVFGPAVFCLMQEQIGMFLLLGCVLFFYLQERRPFLAGASLLLLELKPHLFLPFAVALLLWIFARRAYSLLAGAVSAFVASMALAFFLDRSCIAHYRDMVRASSIQDDFIPSLSQGLRLLLHPGTAWLQLVPAALGCAWAAWYFATRRSRWDWTTHGPVLLLVSVMLAPYQWFSDQAVLLLPIMTGLYRAPDRRRALWAFGLLAAICLGEMMASLSPRSWFYVWTTPAWLLWYLYAARPVAPPLGDPALATAD